MKVPTTLTLRPSTSKSTSSSSQHAYSTDSMPQVKRTISQTFTATSDTSTSDKRAFRRGTVEGRPQKERKLDDNADQFGEAATESKCKKLMRRASQLTTASTAASSRSRRSLSHPFKSMRQDTATSRDSALSTASDASDVPSLRSAEEPETPKAPSLLGRMERKIQRFNNRPRRGGASGPSGEEAQYNPSATPYPADYCCPAMNLNPSSGPGARASWNAATGYANAKASDSGTSLHATYEHPDEGAVIMSGSSTTTTVNNPNGIDFTKYLPSEITFEIFGHLDITSLTKAEGVSKGWQGLASARTVWQEVFRKTYQPKIHVSPAPIQMGGDGFGEVIIGQDWKRMCIARKTIDRRWRLSNPAATYFNGHTDSVYCCQFDEKKIITGSRDRTIRVWDMETKRCLKVIGGPSSIPVKPVTNPLSVVEKYTISNLPTLNGTAEGRAIYTVPSDYHSQSILCLQYDEELMVTGSSDSTCIVWDVKTFKPIRRLRRHIAGVLDVCLDAKYIISCSKDASICVWDRHTGDLLKVLYGHKGPVNAVQLRGDHLVSASGDGVARLWSLASGQCIKEFASKDGGLAAVEFTDDAKYVLAGGNNQVVFKFDVETGETLHHYTGHTGLVRSLFVDAPNNVVVSGSYDQSIRVYDFASGDVISNYENWTTSWILSAKSDYRRIVCTSQDGRALMLDFGHGVNGAELLQRNSAITS